MIWLYIYLFFCLVPLLTAIVSTVLEDIDRARNPNKYRNEKFGKNWQWGVFGFTQYFCVACFIPILNLYCMYIMIGIAVISIKEKLLP